MQLGLVGLPRVGKTTLFSALVGKAVDRGYGKRETHIGVAKVPDPRLEELTALFNPRKQIHATVEYVDVAGLEAGTGKAGYDESFLKALSQTDALVLVVRGFTSEEGAAPDPLKEFTSAEEEFLLNDLGMVEKRVKKLEEQLKKLKNPEFEKELILLKRCLETLEKEKPLRVLEFDIEEEKRLAGFQFLSYKPLLVVINIGEDFSAKAEEWKSIIAAILSPHSAVLTLQGELECEIAQLEEADREVFLQDMGITEPASHRVVRASYELLKVISFFTVGEDECRAWTIKRGSNAVAAAGTIHTDLARGFIRAEVTRSEDQLLHKTHAVLKEKGLTRLEGKEYVVQDGDILVIRFAV